MRIYYYDTETGIYQGEDFADEGMWSGQYEISPGSTTIAPPSAVPGHCLCFDAVRQQWLQTEIGRLSVPGIGDTLK
ncbi:hypothetical protein [Geomobilimonas luticola]|uniref:Tail fiber assembly protein n=1 Tax=Geomobilimonas luticola TaxID=1114878 RepID=A0ABS5SDT1_9BACT|nr:hypothetical protein [Geomobilimonas luticola]MBT0653530.1 hypothetical protein [Geomobilimonas luticola]